MRTRPSYLVPCILTALVLVTCARGPQQLPTPALTANATEAPARATPSPTPQPSPAPTATSPSDPVSVPPTDAAATAPPPGTADDASISAPVDTRVRPVDGMVMVHVPGGTFAMGSAGDDVDALPDEMPQHTVTLHGFWIDQTEVTNAHYVQFLNEHGNAGAQGVKMIELDQGYARISQDGAVFVTTGASHGLPVVMVTWHGAATYCEWAGGRLPTEAEWEYAARGPEGSPYPWGSTPPNCDLANYGDCNRAATQVGSRPAGASWCGADDMAGNVWEWVADWFGPYTARPQEDPTGPVTGGVPVLRGGGWHSPRWELRAAYRQHEVAATGFNG